MSRESNEDRKPDRVVVDGAYPGEQAKDAFRTFVAPLQGMDEAAT